jgi:hypothetical protein
MFPKLEGVWVSHPILADISDDDPELQAILRGIGKAVLLLPDMVAAGPHKVTTLYDHMKPYDEEKPDRTGLLLTWLSMNRRCSYALDYAKYLLVLKRLGESKPRMDPPAGRRRARVGKRPESAGVGRTAP